MSDSVWCAGRQLSTAVERNSMPMELGIHLGLRLFGGGRQRRRRALILEAEPHREAALSDVGGQSIEFYGNDPDQAIRCVRNWLPERRSRNAVPQPGAAVMQADYRGFRDEVGSLRRPSRRRNLIAPST